MFLYCECSVYSFVAVFEGIPAFPWLPDTSHSCSKRYAPSSLEWGPAGCCTCAVSLFAALQQSLRSMHKTAWQTAKLYSYSIACMCTDIHRFAGCNSELHDLSSDRIAW